MKMSNYIACCDKCFDTLARKDAAAAKLWMELCILKMVEGDIVAIRGKDTPELRTIESNGYITSTDTLNHLLIRVNGHMIDELGQDFFCITGNRHGE